MPPTPVSASSPERIPVAAPSTESAGHRAVQAAEQTPPALSGGLIYLATAAPDGGLILCGSGRIYYVVMDGLSMLFWTVYRCIIGRTV